jgi:hypothetical protein
MKTIWISVISLFYASNIYSIPSSVFGYNLCFERNEAGYPFIGGMSLLEYQVHVDSVFDIDSGKIVARNFYKNGVIDSIDGMGVQSIERSLDTLIIFGDDGIVRKYLFSDERIWRRFDNSDGYTEFGYLKDTITISRFDFKTNSITSSDKIVFLGDTVLYYSGSIPDPMLYCVQNGNIVQNGAYGMTVWSDDYFIEYAKNKERFKYFYSIKDRGPVKIQTQKDRGHVRKTSFSFDLLGRIW